MQVMSYNPVELVRSCAHEALHALLDGLPPTARRSLLAALLQVRWHNTLPILLPLLFICSPFLRMTHATPGN